MEEQIIENFDALVYPEKNWRLPKVNILVNKGRYFEFDFWIGPEQQDIKDKVLAEWGDKAEVTHRGISMSVCGPKSNVKHIVHVLNTYGFTVKTKHDWI